MVGLEEGDLPRVDKVPGSKPASPQRRHAIVLSLLLHDSARRAPLQALVELGCTGEVGTGQAALLGRVDSGLRDGVGVDSLDGAGAVVVKLDGVETGR